MANQMYTLSAEEARAFLAHKGNTRKGVHAFSKRVKLSKGSPGCPYCANCGLLCLKNEATRRAMKAQCVWLED